MLVSQSLHTWGTVEGRGGAGRGERGGEGRGGEGRGGKGREERGVDVWVGEEEKEGRKGKEKTKGER